MSLFKKLLVGLCALPAVLVAQETRAGVAGTITDPTGSVIAGARVRLANTETGVVFTTTTNESGQYRFVFLNPGRYTLTAEHTGFKTFERGNIELSVNQAATLPVMLEVGSQSERIVVAAEAPLVEAEKADRGLVIDNRKVVDLPINTRNPIMLAALSNGITHTSGSTLDLKPFSNSADGSWSINGGKASTAEFLLDGAPNNALYNGVTTVAIVPSVDAVQEFKVMTSTYDAQYGHSGGGAINFSLKSGANSVHGSAYEFLKRTGVNANTFANNSHGSPLAANLLDQYGFTIGGPVALPKLYRGKDRTFFFFAFEKYRENQEYPSERISSVPTPAQRKGDFSNTRDNQGNLINIYDPLTGRFDANNRWVRDRFPGNIIPPNRINPVTAKLLTYFPEPNTRTNGSTEWQNNFFLGDNIAAFNFKNVMARVDHNFSSRERVYARWSWSNFDQVRNQNAIPGPAANWRNGGKYGNGGVVDSVTMLTPTTILDVRAALNYWRELIGPPDFGFNSSQLGWPSALVSQLPNSNLFPNIGISDYTGFGQSSGNLTFEPTTQLSLQPNLALIRGRHTIKTGLDFRLTRYTQFRPNLAGGSLNFDRGFTRADYLTQDAVSGNSMASMLLGYPSSGSVDNLVNPFFQWAYFAPWVQEDIKVGRKLAVNLGLRWDYSTPVTERFNRLDRGFLADVENPISRQIDPTRFPGFKVNGGIGFVGQNGESRSPFNSDRNNWQPRIGAAYQIDEKTVLRGGWGLFYLTPVDVGQTLGFSQNTPYVATQDSGRTPFNVASNPFPSGILQPRGSAGGLSTFLGQGITFSNSDFRDSYVHQFSFGIQRELPGRMSIEASYVGSRTRNAAVSKGINEISKENLAKGDPSRGGDPNYLSTQLPNPFQNLLPGTGINGATVSRSQLLRPYPQFGGITETNLNTGKIWYNSLQASLQKRYAHGLTFTANYTFSKNIEALSYLNAQDPAPSRTLTAWDRPHRFAFAPIYELPFGPGQRFLHSRNRVLGRLTGGWQVVMNTVVQSGPPMGIPTNVYILGDVRLADPTWDRLFKTGTIDVNGAIRNVLPGEQPVFAVRPPNTLRVTPVRWGNLRDRWAQTYDLSMIKNTKIRENINFQFRFEAFNALNTPVFSGDPNLTPTSTNFGKIIRDNGQSNQPRSLQFGFRVAF